MASNLDLLGYHLTFDAEMSTVADINKFSYSFTNGDRTLYNNHEAQYYVDNNPSNPSNPFSFANGALTITARPTPAGGLPYTSGLLQTANTFTQSEGYFEIRAETPNAHGFWSAFWMLSTSGPLLESDILEQPNNSGSANDYWFHIATPTDNSGYFTDTGVNLASGYHTYGFKWDSSTISYYFDGKSIGYSHATPVELQGQQMYLLANLAVGGAGSWPGQPASGASAAYNIDYIRAYSTDPATPSVALETVSSPDGVDTTPVTALNAPPNSIEVHAAVLAGGTVLGSAGVAGNGALANTSDPDGDSLFVSAVSGGTLGQAVAGQYGHLTLNADGAYSYVADNTAAMAASPIGSHLHDRFSFTVSDGHGGATSSSLDITLDRAPLAAQEAAAVLAGGTVLGSAGVAGNGALANTSDPDGDSPFVSAVSGGSLGQAVAGQYGHLTLNADGAYSYVADNTVSLTGNAYDTFNYIISDGQGGSTPTSLSINVQYLSRSPNLALSNDQDSNITTSSNITVQNLNDIYRFFDTITGDHFYTTSSVEKSQIQGTIPAFNYEGSPWSTPDAGADTHDVFRFFDTKTGTHFFTDSVNERDTVIATIPSYKYEGVAFEAYNDAGGVGRITLERFYNTQTGQHHFAGNTEEAASINQGQQGLGWIDEGKAFTVHVPTDGILHA